MQFVVLYWSAEYPALMEWPDNIRILENMGIAGIIHVDEVRDLQKIYRDYRDTVHRLSLQNQPAWIDESEFVEQRALVTDIFQRLIG